MVWLPLMACDSRGGGRSGVCLGGRLRGGMWRLWQHGGGVRSGESGWLGDGRRPNGGAVAAVRWGPWRAEREKHR